MLEVPFLDEILEEKYGNLLAEKTREAVQKNIVTVLKTRFGDVPRDVVEAIESVVDEKQLEVLVRSAAACPDLTAFRHAEKV